MKGMSLAKSAIELGRNKAIMDSYWAFHKGKQIWFFSPNPNLKGATKKPSSFTTWKDWRNFATNQRRTLAVLSGFNGDGKKIIANNTDLKKLKDGYTKWNLSHYSIPWGGHSKNKIWLCNVFVGDAIYSYNKTNFTSGNKHYYDPKQLTSGLSNLKKRASHKDVQIGDVVAIGTGHVEIITDINKYYFADDGFCSIGAGRGVSPNSSGGNGAEKCDTKWTLRGTRELDNENNTYYYL